MATTPREVPAILQALPSLTDVTDKERPMRLMLAALEYYGVDPESDHASGDLLYALLVDRFPAFREPSERRPGRPTEHGLIEMARLHQRVMALFEAAGLDPSKKGSTKKLLADHHQTLRSEFPGFAQQHTTKSEYNYLARCRDAHATYQHWQRWNRKHMRSLLHQVSPAESVPEKG